MFASDSSSERASSIEDYQSTCAQFIMDISRDYVDWVDRYNLAELESAKRRNAIKSFAKETNDWIFRYGDTIKKVDIIMNDGVNKMAESTAGYPFIYEIKVNETSRYTISSVGSISLNLKAVPRPGRRVRVGNYQKDQLLLINSSGKIDFSLSAHSLESSDMLDDYLILDASQCCRGDVVSTTLVAEELQDDNVMESRGFSTLILLT